MKEGTINVPLSSLFMEVKLIGSFSKITEKPFSEELFFNI